MDDRDEPGRLVEPEEPEERRYTVAYSALDAAKKFGRLQAQSHSLIRNLLGRFGQKPELGLLAFDQVRRLLRSPLGIDRGMQIIPIANIVGSVGRYRDFDRAFLPLSGADEQRWRELDVAMNEMRTLPPIDVYKVGNVYFVRDGNHRVSVAKANGLTHIDAYVTEIKTRVPLTPDIDAEGLIIKEEYAQFLEETGLDESRPDAQLDFSVPGHYELLLEHIQVRRYYMGLEQQRDVSLPEAAVSWYDTVYCPVVEAIRVADVLKEFPGRTETDLYLWVAYHRERLSERYGVAVPEREVLERLARDFSERGMARFTRSVRRAVKAALEAAGETPEPPAQDMPASPPGPAAAEDSE
jgi:hypothetical protein